MVLQHCWGRVISSVGVTVVSPGALVLIGQDLLATCRFTYDGRKRRLTMSYWHGHRHDRFRRRGACVFCSRERTSELKIARGRRFLCGRGVSGAGQRSHRSRGQGTRTSPVAPLHRQCLRANRGPATPGRRAGRSLRASEATPGRSRRTSEAATLTRMRRAWRRLPRRSAPCCGGATTHYSLDSTPERVENRAWWVRRWRQP